MKATGTVYLLLLCVVAEAHYPTEFPYVSFMGQTLANHSYVDLSLVGTNGNDPGNTVRCYTDLCSCCREEQGVDCGDWFFLSGVSLQRSFVSNGVRYIYTEINE